MLSVNNLLRNGLDLSVLFFEYCLYISIIELANEYPLMVIHFFTISFKQISAMSSSLRPTARHQAGHRQ